MSPFVSSLLKFLLLVALIWVAWNFLPLLALPFAAIALVGLMVGGALLLGMTVVVALGLGIAVVLVVAALGVVASLLPVIVPALVILGIVLLVRRGGSDRKAECRP